MTSPGDENAADRPQTPLEALGVLASQEVAITDRLRHVELYTMRGLLTVLWHGRGDEDAAVIAMGGAMGGLLGPAEGLYHQLGEVLLADHGIATLRISYRKPNDLDACVHDAAAAVQLAVGNGADKVVTLGHSFGGAVAIRTGVLLSEMVAGVCTFATQSAGCEIAGGLSGRPFLLFHGDRDEILPVDASFIVREIAGWGEVVVLPGDGHLLARSGPVMGERLVRWIPETLRGAAPS